MKKLPQDNAPSVMKPWIRSVLEVLSTFDSDIAKLKDFASKITNGTGSTNGITNGNISATKLANYPTASLVPVMTSGIGAVSIAVANTPVSVAITYPVGLFTLPPTVLITPRSTGDANIVYLTSTSATETGFNATANRSIAGSINFSWIAIGN